jgi:uncharacterized membrane protein YeiH
MDNLVYVLDLLGVGVFAVSGALKASQKRMDVFGFVLIAAVTGIGGGTLRDLLLGIRPVFWITRTEYLAVCTVVAVAIFFVAPGLKSRQRWLVWADAVGLATFCVVGTQVALSVGTPVSVAVLMGVMTAAFGGIIRDVLCGEIPLVLQREIYATAAAAGSIVYVAVLAVTDSEAIGMVSAFVVALAARGAGIVFGLSLPTYGKEQ